jgi:hypothetical protein
MLRKFLRFGARPADNFVTAQSPHFARELTSSHSRAMASRVEATPAIWLGTAIGNFDPELYGDEYVSLQIGDRVGLSENRPQSEIDDWTFGRASGRDSG